MVYGSRRTRIQNAQPSRQIRGKFDEPQCVTLSSDEDDDSLKLMKEAFDLMDSDGSGAISKEELGAVLDSICTNKNDVTYRMLEGLDKAGDPINFEQFAAHLSLKKGNLKTSDGIKKVFELIDDRSGKITPESLAFISKEYDIPFTEEQCKEIFDKVAPGKGYLTPAEFAKIMKRK